MVGASDLCVTAATSAGMAPSGKYLQRGLIRRWSFQVSLRDQHRLSRGWVGADRTDDVLHVDSMDHGSDKVVDQAVGTSESGAIRQPGTFTGASSLKDAPCNSPVEATTYALRETCHLRRHEGCSILDITLRQRRTGCGCKRRTRAGDSAGVTKLICP